MPKPLGLVVVRKFHTGPRVIPFALRKRQQSIPRKRFHKRRLPWDCQCADPSPFALASLIQLRKIQAGVDVQQRYRFKLAFIRELYSRGYGRDDIIKLFRFMDDILRLPDDLAARFRGELESIE